MPAATHRAALLVLMLAGAAGCANPDCAQHDDDRDGALGPAHADCPEPDPLDCDDNDPDVFPGAAERCDGVDNNCDGLVDDARSVDAATWFADLDGDGLGDPSSSVSACEQPPGMVDNPDDCDDSTEGPCPTGTGTGTGTGGIPAPVQYWGTTPVGGLGYGLSGGDIDGDGYSELVIGAPYDGTYGPGAGRAFTVAGGPNPADGPLSTYGTEIVPSGDGQFLGISSSVGDLDRDGRSDLALGLPGDDNETGAVVVLFGGGAAGLGDLFDGQWITGAAPYERVGVHVALTGDATGDNLGEVLIGARPEPGGPGATVAYWVPGIPGVDSLSVLDGDSFVSSGDVSVTGLTVAAPGDLNGDGLADAALGDPEVESGVYTTGDGLVSVHLGQLGGLGTRNLLAGELLVTGSPSSLTGIALAGPGDVNGDGYADLLVGAPGEQGNNGAAHLFLGAAQLGDLTTEQSRTRLFVGRQILAGSSVAGGDLNNDGYADLLIGCSDGLPGGTGGAWLELGGPTLPTEVDLDQATHAWTGPPGAYFGLDVAVVGDANGDGFEDFAVSAPLDDLGGNDSGSVTLLFGGPL